MGHTYTRLIAHGVFSTKDRIPYLLQDRREDIFAYLGGVLRGIQCEVLAINGVSDHVHTVFSMPPLLSLSDAMARLKGNSSKWIHEKRILPRAFSWQRGYSAFSVSESNVEMVLRYVANQEAHHRKISFQEELRAFLQQHRIPYDERYMWD